MKILNHWVDGYIRGVKVLKISEIKDLISSDKSSERKTLARKGEDYYNGLHDIRYYKMYYYNADGELVEDKHRSNIKISHPFFTELVDQCVQYMLSGENYVKSDLPELQNELDKYFGDDFTNELVDTGVDAKTKGFGYMYAYTSKGGITKFLSAESMGVVEVRATETDDNCKYVIYHYTDRIGKDHRKISRIQVWDEQFVYYYVQDEEGTITIDEDAEYNPRPHIVYTKSDGEDYGASLGYIPFFKLKNNRYEKSDLFAIKQLIDDYDLMACGLSNNITDFDYPIYAVSGFPGDNLDELIQNFRTKKTIGTELGGGVDIKTVDIPYQARLTKLELDEKNIYRFGMGFNSAQLGDGNITNVVIKSRYALLDLKCNKFEKQLRAFLNQLVQVALDEINKRNDSDYQLSDVYYEFEREVMTNASDNASIKKTEADTKSVEINTLLNLASVIDKDTLLKNICDILEIDYEEIKDKLPKSESEIMDEVEKQLGE